MANPTIKLKRSSVQGKIPTTGQLPLGELAINTYDGKLFLKKDDGTESIVEVGAGTANQLTTSTTFGGDVSGTYNAIVVANDSHTHDTRYYTETESDSRFLGISAKAADSNLLDGIDSSQFLRSDAADSFSGTLTGALSSGGTAIDLATNDNYASMRVIRNQNTGAFADGMYIGYANGNSGYTRIFGGGATSGGITVTGSGASNVTIAGNVAWNAGNDGAGSALDADLLDGQQGSYYLNYNNLSNKPTIGNGTLTLNVSGTGLSGSTSFTANQSGNSTFTVTSNATSANTASTIVARDGSGNFSAGAITATSERLSGNLSAWNTTTPGTGLGGLHLGAASGTSNVGPAITFGARDISSGGTAQAGIYINSDGTYGTRMYLATSDNYTTGSKVAMSISESGIVNFSRATPTSGENTIWHAGNDGSGSGLDADLLDGISSASFLRSDAADSWSGTLSYGASDTHGLSFQNATYSANSLYIGGWTTANTNGISRIRNSTGNLHIDSAANGSLYLNQYSSGGVYARGNVVWHAGNDGAGSGLDADLLDGQQGSYYLNYSNFSNTPTIGNGTLTLNVSGTGLSGSQTFTANQSGNATFTVTSNATSANTASTIVARDASGNFTAGTITAALSGNSTTATNISGYSGTYWTSNNDGAGSGLDADLLDGQQGSYYQPASTALKTSTTFGGDVSGTYNAIVVANDSHQHTQIYSKGNYVWTSSTAPRNFPDGISLSFVQSSNGWQSYGTVVNFHTYPNDGATAQFYFPYSASFGGNSMQYRLGLYNNAGWTGWKTIWDNTNDGAGSGLDADLLDGQQGSYYAPKASPSFTGTPTAPTASAGTNTTQLATTAFVSTAVSNLVDSAPGTLDTLNELAAALGDDSNFSTTVTNSIATKLALSGGTMTGNIAFSGAQTVDGRDLSADGSKLDGIAAGAEVNVQSDWNATSGDALILNKPTIPTNNNQLTNGAGYITSSGSITGSAGTLDGLDSTQFLRSDAADTSSTTYTFTNTSINPKLDFSGHAGAANYNYFMRASNDTGVKAVHFVNGSTRTGDGGINTYTIRNDAGSLRLGRSEYSTLIEGSGDLTFNANEVWHAGNDGAGSGLDADLLDGISSASFLRGDVDDTFTRLSGIRVSCGFDSGNDNSVGCSNWFRSSGSTGWYNQTYGGGWYMQDTTWIRSYNNKSIYHNTGTLRTDGTLQVGSGGATFNAPNGGTVTISGSTAWHAGNDGAGSGLDADLLDGLNSTQFLRSDAVAAASQRIQFTANSTNNWDNIATTQGNLGCIEIRNDGAGNDAFMAFHASSDFAFYFGLDASTNDLSVGGWSMGANKYRVWHAGNDGAGSGLDADILDGQQGSYYLNYNNFTNTPTIPTNNNQLTNGAGYITSSGSITGSAGTLDGLDSTQFLRSDAADTATGIITFNADTRYGSQSSQQGGGLAVQRVWNKSVAAGQLYQLGTWHDTEGTASILIQVSSETSGNSGTSTYLWQGGFSQLTGSYYRLYPLNVGRGHGQGADTGENTNAWQVFIYGTTVTGSNYIYGLAVHVASGASNKNLVVTATELKRGMSFTDQGSSSVITSFTNSGNIFSNRTVLAENVKIGSSFSQVWHAGNDGARSGLDADLLDGLNANTAGANVILKTSSSGYILHDNWIRIGSGNGLYNSNGAYFYEDTTYGWFSRSRISNSSSIRLQVYNGTNVGWLYADSSLNQGFLSSGGGWRLFIPNSGNIKRDNLYGLWDSGNDGSGSGLDADLLDGQ